MQSQPWPIARPQALARLVGSTSQCRHRAVRSLVSCQSSATYSYLRFLGERRGRNAYLVVVGKVGPGHNVDEQLGVPRVAGSDTLEVVGHCGNAVQGLALLDLVDHLAHIHLNLALVLGESVETVCSNRKHRISSQL